MKVVLTILFAVITTGAFAQERKVPEIKMLAPADCDLIEKRSENEFYIRGPVTLGGLTMINQSLARRGVISNGVDYFDIIQRSCYAGRPL
jgi:hypothetical protein